MTYLSYPLGYVLAGFAFVGGSVLILKGVLPESWRISQFLFRVKKLALVLPGIAFCAAGIIRFSELTNDNASTFDAYASAATVYGFGLIFLQFIEPSLKSPVILGIPSRSQNHTLSSPAGDNRGPVVRQVLSKRYIVKIRRHATRLNGVALKG